MKDKRIELRLSKGDFEMIENSMGVRCFDNRSEYILAVLKNDARLEDRFIPGDIVAKMLHSIDTLFAQYDHLAEEYYDDKRQARKFIKVNNSLVEQNEILSKQLKNTNEKFTEKLNNTSIILEKQLKKINEVLAGQVKKINEVFAGQVNRTKVIQKEYYNMACHCSLLKDKDSALKYLRKAIGEGYDSLSHIQEDPDFKYIKKSKEFKMILKTIGG